MVFSGLYRLPAGFDVSGRVDWQSGRPFNAAGLPFATPDDEWNRENEARHFAAHYRPGCPGAS